MRDFMSLPQAESCRLIEFDKCEIRPGFLPDTYVLVVSGTKPYANMEVNLVPLIYIMQPDYWGIEVVGCLRGIGIPVLTPYTVSLPLDSVRGTKGIEVIGAKHSEKHNVPPTVCKDEPAMATADSAIGA